MILTASQKKRLVRFAMEHPEKKAKIAAYLKKEAMDYGRVVQMAREQAMELFQNWKEGLIPIQDLGSGLVILGSKLARMR